MADGNLKELIVKILGDNTDATKKLESTGKQAQDIGKKTSGIAGGFQSGAKAALGFASTAAGIIGVGLGVTSVTSYIQGAIQGAEDMQVAQANTNRILQSGSHVAGLTASAVDNLSTQLMNQTGVDDDVVRGAENILAGYNNISLKAYPQVTQAAIDMARAQSMATGQAFDAAGAARVLGIAMQDPAKGARLLRGYNIILSASQQEAIKTATKHGDIMKAQAVIMQAVTDKVNGASAAYKGTAAGGAMSFQTAMDNIQKTIGTALLPILSKLLSQIVPLAQGFAAQLPGAISMVQGALGNLQGPLNWLTSHVDMTKVVMGVLAAGFVLWAISAGAAAVSTIAATWPILAVIAAVAALVAIFTYAYSHWTGFRIVVDTVRDAIGRLAQWLGPILGQAFAGMGQNIGNMLGFLGRLKDGVGNVLGAIGDFRDGAVQKFNDLKDKITGVINGVISFFKNFHLPLPHFSFGGSFSLNPPSVPTLGVKWYGSGAVFSSPNVIGVGERGPEAVAPLSSLASMIRDAISGGNGKPGGGDTYNFYGTNLTAKDVVDELNWQAVLRGYTS